METLNWTKTTARERSASYAVLEAEASDGAVVRFHLEDQDGEVRPSFTVKNDEGVFCTDDAEDWPAVEAYVPRSQWPEPMYVGKKGPSERTPDAEISQAVAEYSKMLEDE